MAEQPPQPKIVLEVNINCCLGCPKKLEKALLKLKGVSSFAINKEENRVSVEGTVDPDKIIKLIYKKVSKRAKLISYTPPAPPPSRNKKDEAPKNTNRADDKKDSNSKSKNTKPADDNKDSNNKSKHKDEEANMHKRCFYQDGNYPKMAANNEHICEESDPSPKVQDFVHDQDYFCRHHHPRSRNLTDKVPEDESAYMHNYEQGYYGAPSIQYPIRGSSYCPQWYWYPERPPAQLYGYYYPPPPPYGYY